MLNFTNDTAVYTTRTRTTRNSNFTTFTSKKQLIASSFLQDEQLAYITNIVGLFNTAIHNSKQYAVCTLYKNSIYTYIVVNLLDGSIAEVQSVAVAKNEVEQLVCNTTNEDNNTQATTKKASKKATK